TARRLIILTDGLSAKLLRIFIYALLTQGGDSVAETISEGRDVLPALIREGALIYDDTTEGTHGEDRREGEGKPEGAELDGAPNAPSGNGDNNGVPRDGDRSPSVPTDGDVGLLSDKGADPVAEPVAEAVEEKKAEPAEAQTQTFEVTAYTAGAESTGKTPSDPAYGITASGEKVREGY